MPFVKLDTGILNSTLWIERECRELFITALLMAEPWETEEPLEGIRINSLEPLGFTVPPGWYGFVHAASLGIIGRAGMDREIGLIAMEKLSAPDVESRSPEFEGRRMIRVDGGFVILNYMKYRDRDYTSAERSKRYRERLKSQRVNRDDNENVTQNVTLRRDITQADSRVHITEESKPKTLAQQRTLSDGIYEIYPRKVGKTAAIKAITKAVHDVARRGSCSLEEAAEALTKTTQAFADSAAGQRGAMTPHPATWFNRGSYLDDPKEWEAGETSNGSGGKHAKSEEAVSGKYEELYGTDDEDAGGDVPEF